MNKSKKNVTATCSKLLTPCRSVGLTRKRKQVTKFPTQNENNVNSFNENSSGGSQDTVEESASKLKNFRKKQKVMNEENYKYDELQPIQRLKTSRKKQKTNREDVLEVSAISETGNEIFSVNLDHVEDKKFKPAVTLKTRKNAKIRDEVTSVEDEKSSGSRDNVKDEKKSKFVKLKSRKKAQIHDNEFLEAPVVIPEAENENNSSVEDEKSSGSRDNVKDENKSKFVKLKSRKKAKIHDNEVLEAPVVILEAGNENNNSVEDEKSSGSQDNVEDEKKFKHVKLKSRKKAKIHDNAVVEAPVVIPEAGNENNNSDEDERSSRSKDNVHDENKSKLVKLKPRKKAKIHDNEVLESPVVITEAGNENNNSVEDEKSSGSRDNVKDEKKSKFVKLKSRKKATIHDNKVLEARVVIPEAGNENNNSVEDENSSGNQHNVEFAKESKNVNLISQKKAKIQDDENLEVPVIPETGNENINSVNDENSSRNDDNLDNVKQSKHVKLKSRKKAKIHNEEILEEPVVIPQTRAIHDEIYSGTRDNVEYEKLSSQNKTEDFVPDIMDESSSGGGENIENVALVQKLQDNENSVTNTEDHFNENSSTTSEDSEPLSIWKTRNEVKTNVGQQKLTKNEEKYLEPSERAKLNLKTTQIFVNLVRCDLLLEELRKSNSSLATSQEYLDDEVANINKTNTYLETETNVEISKKKRTSLGAVRKSVTKKQSPVKKEKRTTDLKNKSTESLKSNISVTNDYNELSDFSPTVKPRGRKSSSAIKFGKPSPKPIKKNIPKQIAPNKTLVVKKADSDDDFVEKIPRNRSNTEIEYIKRERVKIGENNSYTIVQRNNMISYIKSNDSSSIVKPDDTIQNISPNICILDHKNYLPETTPSQAVDGMFDNFVSDEESKMNQKPVEQIKEKLIDLEKKRLLERKASLMKKVKDKHDKLERLKRISIYKQEHNLKDLQELALQIKRGLQEALVDLLCQLKDQQEKPYTMQSLLKNFSIPFELVGYNLDDDNFV